MITANEKELLIEYFDKYKSFFVTEHDATDKKLYLRIWIDGGGIYFQQDWFSSLNPILYTDIIAVTSIQNRLVIKCGYPPFPDKYIHIEGYEDAMYEMPDNNCTITNWFQINKEIIKPNSPLIDWAYSYETDDEAVLIFDLFRLGKMDFEYLHSVPVNKDWLFNFLHTHLYKDYTKTFYIRIDKSKILGWFGLWDLINKKSLNEFPIKILKKFSKRY